jgi:heavy metal sensor kinase
MKRIRLVPGFRLRLTLWNVAAMVVILAIYAGTVYAFVFQSGSEGLNDRLRADFQWPREMLERLPDGTIETFDESADTDASPWLQVWSLEGELLYSTWNAERSLVPQVDQLALEARNQIVSVGAVDPPWRVLSGESNIGGESFVIQVARSEQAMRQERSDLLFILLLGLPIGVALAGLGGYSLSRRALAPVNSMAERARTITAERLQDRLPVDNPHDELGRLATVFNDTLTRLESSFDQMRRFTSDASHELRTPLTALRSVGEVGLRGPKTEKAYREIIASMLEEVDSMSALVERLLMLSRADTGQAKLSLETIELGQLADDVAGQLDVLADEKQQTVTVRHDKSVRWTGDRLVLRQAVTNLVDNAIKYTPRGGQITVRVDWSLGMAVLEVTDTGPGIPPSLQERVFDRFYRVDGSRSRGSGGGMGLGLSIAKWAVEAHGGRLTLEESAATGSTFRITLPEATFSDSKPLLHAVS